MIKSKYIEGETVPEFDAKVAELLKSHGIEGGGNSMNIAIENHDGRVYRSITTWGMGAFMHVVQSLPSAGLVDLLKNEHQGRKGFDAWFKATPSSLKGAPERKQEPEVKPVLTDEASDILGSIEALQTLPETERESVILSRVGQGVYRSKLVSYWGACAVTGAACVPLLRASHIKPWRDSNNMERLDLYNGLLLAPNLDAAFDAGFISFDHLGKIMMSHDIGSGTAYQLHISPKSRISQKLLTKHHEVYFKHHRQLVFRGA